LKYFVTPVCFYTGDKKDFLKCKNNNVEYIRLTVSNINSVVDNCISNPLSTNSKQTIIDSPKGLYCDGTFYDLCEFYINDNKKVCDVSNIDTFKLVFENMKWKSVFETSKTYWKMWTIE